MTDAALHRAALADFAYRDYDEARARRSATGTEGWIFTTLCKGFTG